MSYFSNTFQSDDRLCDPDVTPALQSFCLPLLPPLTSLQLLAEETSLVQIIDIMLVWPLRSDGISSFHGLALAPFNPAEIHSLPRSGPWFLLHDT